MKSSLLYIRNLERYSQIYKLLGVIEMELRLRVPATLSKNHVEFPNKKWFEHFEFDRYPAYVLRKAITNNRGSSANIEQKLPFGFWVRIFRNSNFGSIWGNDISEVFPQLEKPRTQKSYRRISKNLNNVHKLRNKVAHYSFIELNANSNEVRDLMFLINALGVDFQLNPRDL
jgi:hypothetical protein